MPDVSAFPSASFAPSILTSDVIGCPHAFSTRAGGVSRGVWKSLNLGLVSSLGDEPAHVAENWAIFGEAAGIGTERFVHGRQVHGDTVLIAGQADAHGILEPSDLVADGYATNVPGLALAVFTADCVPLLMHDPAAHVVAAVHCGWRGTVADIEARAIDRMRDLGADPGRICAAIGPCIHACCFQTGPEVPAALDRLLDGDAEGLYRPDPDTPGRFFTDLPGAVARRLTQLGVAPERIDDLGECTMCSPDRYWSHRRLGLSRGSQASIIML